MPSASDLRTCPVSYHPGRPKLVNVLYGELPTEIPAMLTWSAQSDRSPRRRHAAAVKERVRYMHTYEARRCVLLLYHHVSACCSFSSPSCLTSGHDIPTRCSGWMMWNFLVSSLSVGCTLVLYDGSPLRDPAYLWNLVDELGITIFGTSAKYIDQLSVGYGAHCPV